MGYEFQLEKYSPTEYIIMIIIKLTEVEETDNKADLFL